MVIENSASNDFFIYVCIKFFYCRLYGVQVRAEQFYTDLQALSLSE